MCGIFAYLNFLTCKKRGEIIDILLEGLRRMDYRGYDSAGIALDCDSSYEIEKTSDIELFRKVGSVDVLKKFIDSKKLNTETIFMDHCGIAHTRWATHGSAVDENAHPQRSSVKNDFLVVHNGIITNYNEIKILLLKRGCEFESETDTEVIAKLVQYIHDHSPKYTFRELVETTIHQLEGTFALAFKSRRFPSQLVVAARGSPLHIGIKCESRLTTHQLPVFFSKESAWVWQNEAKKRNMSTQSEIGFDVTSSSMMEDDSFTEIHFVKDATIIESAKRKEDLKRTVYDFNEVTRKWGVEYFIASEQRAIIEHTRQVIVLENDDVAVIDEGALSIHRVKREDAQQKSTREIQELNTELQQVVLGNYKTFMEKEIFEQPESVVNTMRGRVFSDGRLVLGGIKNFLSEIRRCRRLIMVACGTSYNSATACRQIMEELTELTVAVELASDFLDRQMPIFRDDVCFFISQSGETADTLNALRYVKPRGALAIGITNTVGSSISRESHCGIHLNAGPEIGVASTKAYTSQIVVLIMFALTLSEDRISLQTRRNTIIDEMGKLKINISKALNLDEQVRKISSKIYKEKSMLIMGRGYNFATCLEGALKIKELSYIHCEGIMSGELKHGPLAMVDNNMCIIMMICNDKVYKKSLIALQQVHARGGRPIVIADESVPAEDLMGVEHLLRVPCTVDCLENILTIIPLQLFSYYIAAFNGYNVDRPRNLAKSVTVE